MADPKQVETLKASRWEWDVWVRRQGPDFRSDLSGADLNGMDLFTAKLRRANLSGADLSGANLEEANLEEAILSGADLSEASSIEASFIEADLSDANLSHAELTGTRLSGATLGETSFDPCDLSKTVGLEEVRHIGPSFVGPETLRASGGRLPEVFLRGVGWPERLIQYWPAISEEGIQFYSVFISYSSEDKPFAKLLHDRLQGEGVRCWLDEHEILPGDNIRDAIDQGIRRWDKVILVCSEASLTSYWVEEELKRALQKEERLRKQRKKKIGALVPLTLDDFVFNWDDGAAANLIERNIADFRNWEGSNSEFEAQLKRVIAAIRSDDGAMPPKPEPKI